MRVRGSTVSNVPKIHGSEIHCPSEKWVSFLTENPDYIRVSRVRADSGWILRVDELPSNFVYRIGANINIVGTQIKQFTDSIHLETLGWRGRLCNFMNLSVRRHDRLALWLSSDIQPATSHEDLIWKKSQARDKQPQIGSHGFCMPSNCSLRNTSTYNKLTGLFMFHRLPIMTMYIPSGKFLLYTKTERLFRLQSFGLEKLYIVRWMGQIFLIRHSHARFSWR